MKFNVSQNLLLNPHIFERVVIFAIRTYQRTRILRAPSCRFYPSCSEYTAGSVSRHGLMKGLILSVARILRCHPFNAGGVDEVPRYFSLLAMRGKAHEATNQLIRNEANRI